MLACRKIQGRLLVKRLILALTAAAAFLLTGPGLYAQEDEGDTEVREFDHVFLKDVPEPQVGTILRETDTELYIRLRDYPGMETRFSKSRIVDIKYRTSPVQAFNAKRGKVAPGDFKACYELARWSLQYPELREKSKEVLRDCIKRNAKFLDSYLLFSDLLREDRRKSEALTEEQLEQQLNTEIEMYRHAISSGLENPQIFYRLGLAVRKGGLPKVALGYFNKAIEGSGNSSVPEIGTWSRHEAGEILLETGKPREALKHFEAVLSSSPDDFRALLGRGEVKLVLGDLDEAGIALTKAVAADPYFPRPFLLLGSVAYLKGELSDAELWLGRAEAVGLPSADVLTTLGLARARMGKFTSAAAQLARALTVNPGYWQAELARGYLAENEGRVDDAISAYLRALQINDASGMAHFKLAGAYYSAGQKDSAVGELNAALTHGFRPVEVFKLLGRVEYERENYAEAARYLRYAVAADDKDADAYYLLGMSCVKLKRNLLAKRFLQKAVDLYPAHVGALNTLGYLAYAANNIQEAVERFTNALAADPGNSYAAKGMRQISQVLHWDRWEDSFRRPDSDDISNGWTEENDARYGIEMEIDSNAAQFSGTQREANKKVFLSRPERGDTFVRIEAVINGLQAAGARFGVRIEKRDSKGKIQGAVVLMRDVDGSLAYNYTEGRGKWKSSDLPITIEQFPIDLKSHTFGVGLIDSKTGKVELMLDGRKLLEVSCPPLARSKELLVGIYGQADAGMPWTLIVESVCIFRYKLDAKKGPGGF
jgi:tetratricopeptide (TPR) repeat protein